MTMVLRSTVPELAQGRFVASLFAQGEPGVWYDPSDFSTMFQDSAGTTPVTAVGQPVGLMLDKSKGSKGPELVTNGTFDSNINGWIVSPQFPSSTAVEWSNGALHVYNTQGNYGESRSAAIPLTIGKRYVLEMEILAGTTASYWIIIGSSASNDQSGRIVVTSESSGTSPSGYKRWRYSFVASYATAYLYFATNKVAGSHLYADNISVREIPGNHAYQTTATSRPVLSARYNLLTKTEQFDDAVWIKTAVSLDATLVTAPNGTLTAYKATTSSNPHLTQNFTAQAVSYRFSVYLRSTSGTFRVPIAIVGGDGSTVGASLSVTVTTQWQQFSVFATAVVGVNARVQIFSAATPVGTVVEVWGADLRVANDGANLPPYQRVNTSTDYDTAGFPHYLRFDGVDDWLVTNTITPGIDKVQVFAGVRKLSDAARQHVIELSARYETYNGALAVVAPATITTNSYGSLSGGAGGGGAAYATGFTAPITSVVSTSTAISTDKNILRVNGTQAASSTTNQGTGNYLAYPLYIGRRGGTTFPFNGHLYSLIVRFGANLPIETIEKIEKYVNTKTRAY